MKKKNGTPMTKLTKASAKADLARLRSERPVLCAVAERVHGQCAKLRSGPRGFVDLISIVLVIIGVIRITQWCIDHRKGKQRKLGLKLRARWMLRRWRNPSDGDNVLLLKVICEQAPDEEESFIMAAFLNVLPSVTQEEMEGMLLEHNSENQR